MFIEWFTLCWCAVKKQLNHLLLTVECMYRWLLLTVECFGGVLDELVWAAVHQLHEREASAAVQPHNVHHWTGRVQAWRHRLEVHWLRSWSPANYRPHWEGNGSKRTSNSHSNVSGTVTMALPLWEFIWLIWLIWVEHQAVASLRIKPVGLSLRSTSTRQL